MAAHIIARRNLLRTATLHRVAEIDREEELMAAILKDGPDNTENPDLGLLSDGPVNVSSATLMGTMPKADKVLKQETFGKLTSSYEWKPMIVALTPAGLFFSRPGEDALRDLIPIVEVVDIKKRYDIPGEGIPKPSYAESEVRSKASSSRKLAKIASLILCCEDGEAPLHILQLRTSEDGYNSGRTYYLKADSEETCNDWLQQLRASAERAVVLRKAGPSLLLKAKYRLRRIYRSTAVQGAFASLIFLSFVVNIAQTEVRAPPLPSH